MPNQNNNLYCPIASLVTTIVLTTIVAFPARAQVKFVPSPSAISYDNGALPGVAISGTSVVEVHQGSSGFGPLWYRPGHVQAGGTVNWGSSAQYDNGGRPSVAASGNNVIEVHEGSDKGLGPLWYKTGLIQPNGNVVWSANGYQYDNGAKPSIAVSGLNVIEVHQGSANGYGLLWYKTGQIQPNGSVLWSATGFPYEYGGAPRVAASGSNIIEVHEGTASGSGPLWYHTGQFLADGTVKWDPTGFYYDNGAAPAVSLAGATVLEVHQGAASGFGPLWYHAGEFQADGSVAWNPAGAQYDSGASPSIALAGAGALEVHRAGAGFGLELYHTFRY